MFYCYYKNFQIYRKVESTVNSYIKPSTRLNCHQYLILDSYVLLQLYFLPEYFKVNYRHHVISPEIPKFAFKKDVFFLIKTTVPFSHLTKLTGSYSVNKTFLMSSNICLGFLIV